MRPKTDTPGWIAAILSWPWLLPISRAALVSAFLIGGIQKLVDFPAAVAEQAHFGLEPAWLWAAAAIVVELGGSALVIFGRWVWLGAGGLGVLTAVAMLTANDCQSAFNFDPASASNFDPLQARVLMVALAPSELAGVAETVRARVV